MIYPITIDSNTPPYFLGGRLSHFFQLYRYPHRRALLSLTLFEETRKSCCFGTPSNESIRYPAKESAIDITTFLTILKSLHVSVRFLQKSHLIIRNFLMFRFIQVKAFWLILEQTPVWRQTSQQPRASCGIERRDVYGNIPLPCLESNNHRKYINQIFIFLS